MAEIVVCGGSVIGLASAMLLARDGHQVTVFEHDPALPPDLPRDAWAGWERRGVAQFHQPHNLFARSRHVLDDDLPGLTDALVDGGGVWIDPLAVLPPSITDRAPRPGDERMRFVTGRRPMIEATFARHAAEHPGVTVRRGVRVEGLHAGASAADGIPHVDGVVLASGERCTADLVVDAMGRRSKLADWLAAIGARAPHIESEDSGFVYNTRYYTGSERPATFGPPLAPLGSISLLTLQSDNDTWSVTVFGASADTALRPLRDVDRFTAVVGACPLHAHWLAGEPISDVLTMAGVLDRYRRFVVEGRPVATGVVAVGDAWACTNPSAGRGISVGLVHAQRLRDTVRDGLDDPLEFVERFDAATEADVAPFFRNQIAADRIRIAEMAAARDGTEPPSGNPMMQAVGTAAMHDADVFRAMIEVITCVALPQEVFARDGFAERVAPYADEPPLVMPGPSRSELLALLG